MKLKELFEGADKFQGFTGAEKEKILAEIEKKFRKIFDITGTKMEKPPKRDSEEFEELSETYWNQIVEPGWTPRIISKAITKYGNDDGANADQIAAAQDAMQVTVAKKLGIPVSLIDDNEPLAEGKSDGGSLSKIDTSNKMVSYLKANYHFTKSASLTRRSTSNDREVVNHGEVPLDDWDRLQKDLKSLGAKLMKQSKGYSHLTTYKLNDLRFTATVGEDESGNKAMLLAVGSPNPKFDSTPYRGRPDE